MALYCFHCGTEIEAPDAGNFGRNDTCPKCDSDVHSCLNCQHYDESSYNQCREPQADRVLDKDRRNFCEYFSPSSTKGQSRALHKKADLRKLDELFK